MPWTPKQHRYFCANKGKSGQMNKMCHEGIKSDTEAEAMKKHLSKKKK
jgi:hypothetical protein